MELKHVLARQPGPEAAEQLQLYRHTLREKTKQLKVRNVLSLAEGLPGLQNNFTCDSGDLGFRKIFNDHCACLGILD